MSYLYHCYMVQTGVTVESDRKLTTTARTFRSPALPPSSGLCYAETMSKHISGGGSLIRKALPPTLKTFDATSPAPEGTEKRTSPVSPYEPTCYHPRSEEEATLLETWGNAARQEVYEATPNASAREQAAWFQLQLYRQQAA